MRSSIQRPMVLLFGVVMAVLVNTSIYDSTCSKTLVPWTVHCVEDKRQTLNGYFEMVNCIMTSLP